MSRQSRLVTIGKELIGRGPSFRVVKTHVNKGKKYPYRSVKRGG